MSTHTIHGYLSPHPSQSIFLAILLACWSHCCGLATATYCAALTFRTNSTNFGSAFTENAIGNEHDDEEMAGHKRRG
jgi:hypothetical protein